MSESKKATPNLLMNLKNELRIASMKCNARCLYHASKWAAELMVSIPDPPNVSDQKDTSHSIPFENIEDRAILAKTYFDVREYYRSYHILKESTDPLSVFLCYYSLYMAGEQRKEEETLQNTNNNLLHTISLQQSKKNNPELVKIKTELEEIYLSKEKEKNKPSKKRLDSFGLYLYALILKQMKQDDERMVSILLESIKGFKYNWSAWKLLISVTINLDHIQLIEQKISDSIMKNFYLLHINTEFFHYKSKEIEQLSVTLENLFPHSNNLLAQIAIAKYNIRDFDKSQQIFELLRDRDPFRLEYMDIYSNILYVKEDKATLSLLAHTAHMIDKYKSETCCIIANYYSLKGNHEKSLLYFKRALRLNPSFLSACTLAGHELIELRNTPAAIEAYRTAVDQNPRDYRAWYGLGQAYEIMQMHHYSIYYFSKAASIRPYDSRMWCALAECYERLDRIEDAIKCYHRAEINEDFEGQALIKLAHLYHKLNNEEKTCYYYHRVLDHENTEDTADALLFLAEYYKNLHDFSKSEKYCNKLLDLGGTLKIQAQSILHEIRELQNRLHK